MLDDVAHEVEQTVYPAYSDLIDYFVELRPKVTTNHGALALPDGKDWYAWLLRRVTTTDMTPEAVHAMSLAEVARIEAEMDAILRAEGYADGSVGERMQQLAAEPLFLYPDTDAGRRAILADYRIIVAELDPYLSSIRARLRPTRSGCTSCSSCASTRSRFSATNSICVSSMALCSTMDRCR